MWWLLFSMAGTTFVVNAAFFGMLSSVSAMLSSVTTELAVAAFLGSLGCISAESIAGCLGFSAGLFVSVMFFLLSDYVLLLFLLEFGYFPIQFLFAGKTSSSGL